jgi:O-antigen ligase
MPLSLGLLLTSSRAGFLLSLSAILMMVFVERGNKSRITQGRKVALVIAVAGAALALGTRGERVITRFAENSVESTVDSRITTAAITLEAIADRPLAGYGYGTFASVFPLYRDDTLSLKGRWKEAHNSYLEALLGLGVPVAFVLFFGFGWIVMQCLRGALTRKRDRLAPCVAVGASLIVGLHALVDFSIQIQGVALGYAALLGAGYAQSWSSRET